LYADLVKLAPIIIPCAILSSIAAGQSQWTPFYPGDLDNSVYASAVFDDGTGPAMYIGGPGLIVGRSAAGPCNIAKWDGTWWRPVGGGVTGDVNALAVFDEDGPGPGGPALFAAGRITSAGGVPVARIARWDGSTWSPLGSGVTGTVNALRVHDPDGAGPGGECLFVGGDSLYSAGGQVAKGLACWDGSTWTTLIDSDFTVIVRGLEVWGPDHGGPTPPALAVVGFFSRPGNQVNRVGLWDTDHWTFVGGHFGSQVAYCLLASDPDGPGTLPGSLYVGGNPAIVGGTSGVARYDGAAWQAIPGTVSVAAFTMDSFDPDGPGPLFPTLVVGGSGFSIWNGSSIVPSSPLVSGGLRTFGRWPAEGGPSQRLFLGGAIAEPSSRAARVATWDGAAIARIGSIPAPSDGPGLDSTVIGACRTDESVSPPREILVCGSFQRAGSVLTPLVATYNGDSWAPPVPSITGFALSFLARFDGDGTGPLPEHLFLSGDFNLAGVHQLLARFAGASGTAINCNDSPCLTVLDLDASGPQPPALFATGAFISINGQPIRYLARWDGLSWSAVGPDFAGSQVRVSAVAVHDDGTGPALYTGGRFTSAGGPALNNVAKWSGTAWTPLASGIGPSANTNPPVMAMVSFDDDGPGPHQRSLYVCGNFVTAGGVGASGVARWSGLAWSAVGTGLPATFLTGPRAMYAFDEDADGPSPSRLFVGGTFDADPSGGTPGKLARWDGVSWTAVGGGLSGSAVNTLGVHDPDDAGPLPKRLIVGGSFYAVGPYASANLATWGPSFPFCYANCDQSTAPPVLNVLDFNCFLNRFAASDSYANCDGSTVPPLLNVLDFNCFLNRFAAGCP
jgi:hypothetical protein